ncbi:MAG: chloride channel protein [Hormoscilla sp. SP12CHS1]|nr:chloride channel protein [Hormoscilla sp. SP12CHS1]
MFSLSRFLSPKRRLEKASTSRAGANVETCIIGLVSGCSAVLLKNGIGLLGPVRIQASNYLPVWFVLPVIGISFGFIAGWLIEQFAPETRGSGVAQVKSALTGGSIVLNWRVALVKFSSTLLSVSSGLTLGRQGPTVQIGAALAASLARIVPTSPKHRRQMIAAGAAAGLAAGFNAPIAGVLFVIEELLHDVSELTLETAIVASFVGAVVSRLLGGENFNLNREVSDTITSFSAPEIPSFLLLGILAGLLGTLFNQGIITSLTLNRRLPLTLPARMALAGLVSGMAIALLPDKFNNNAGLREILLAGDVTIGAAALAFIAHFLLTCIAYGAGTPGGLFAPTLVLGAALGHMVGTLQYYTLGVPSPTTYALAGMGAFFSAVGKVPITSIVIVFEMTADFNLVLPLMIGSVVAYLVSGILTESSLYQRLLEWNGIQPQAESTLRAPYAAEGLLPEVKAADVMQKKVETLPSQLTLDEVVKAFSRSHHRGFPVVKNARLVGIVTQSDLAKIPAQGLTGDRPVSEIMTAQPVVTIRPTDHLSDVVYRLNRYQLSRLPVTEGRKLVGIITRSDIIRTEGDRLDGKIAATFATGRSYVVYQTKAPATGRGRLLVPLANPNTAPILLQMALSIAIEKDYEIECLQVLMVPRSSPPEETPVNIGKSLVLLEKAKRMVPDEVLPVHTQVRVTHDLAQAILETIKERHIDLMLMGWKGSATTPGRIFGDAVDTLIRQAPCDLVLVKWANSQLGASEQNKSLNLPNPLSKNPAPNYCPVPLFKRWLLPMAGGPNAAVRLLPALVKGQFSPEIRLCQVFDPELDKVDRQAIDRASQFLKSKLKSGFVAATVLRSPSVPEAIIDQAFNDNTDVVMMGAHREGLLQQAIKGNIPEAIASGCNCTVILVRSSNPSNS